MTKIGIAISVFDKFDELELLIDMIKSWDGAYQIGVCCNHKKGLPKHIRNKVDYYVQGRDIPFKESESREKTYFRNQDDNYSIRVRAADCVRMSCKLMTEKSKCDWIIHSHADGFFLSETGLKKFIADCIKKNCYVAIRGTGIDSAYKPFSSTSAFGQADDHFFAFNRRAADLFKVWYYAPEDLLMRKYSVHGTLMTIFAVKFGLSNIWYYKTLRDCLNCYGASSTDDETKPCIYDDEYGFLHIHRGSLPIGYGKALQAYHMYWHTDSHQPESWKTFIEYNYDSNIKGKIRKQNEKLNRQLAIRLFSKKIQDKTRITYKESLIKYCTWKTILKNLKHIVFCYVEKKIFPEVNVLELYSKFNKNKKNDWTDIWRNNHGKYNK